MTQADSVHSTPPINTSADTPVQHTAEPAGALYLKTPTTPEEAFLAIGRLRKAARDEIERPLNFLDSTDNHMEREPDLGWPERFGQSSNSDFVGSTDDREDESEHHEDGRDGEPDLCDEPSLGALEGGHHVDQTNWAKGIQRDLEQDLAESGIGDIDGLHEQCGTQDSQQGSMG